MPFHFPSIQLRSREDPGTLSFRANVTFIRHTIQIQDLFWQESLGGGVFDTDAVPRTPWPNFWGGGELRTPVTPFMNTPMLGRRMVGLRDCGRGWLNAIGKWCMRSRRASSRQQRWVMTLMTRRYHTRGCAVCIALRLTDCCIRENVYERARMKIVIFRHTVRYSWLMKRWPAKRGICKFWRLGGVVI